MSKPDEILLAAATRTVIAAINWNQHKNILRVESTYRYDHSTHDYIPEIKVEMKDGCCCKR